MFPATTHEQFAQKLFTALKGEKRFQKPKRSMTAFTLTHYAGEAGGCIVELMDPACSQ
jgi:myosin-5